MHRDRLLYGGFLWKRIVVVKLQINQGFLMLNPRLKLKAPKLLYNIVIIRFKIRAPQKPACQHNPQSKRSDEEFILK